MTDDAVSASARGASFLILLQIGSRALTFALNQILLRFLSPELLGAAVQLELFVISAHHFARESLRVACQRQPGGGLQAAINLSYLAIAGGIPIVLALAQWYLTTDYPDVPYFVESLRISQFAAVVELLSEPAFVTVQQNMLYKTRAAAEASAVVLKTITTASVVFWAQSHGRDLGVLPFAVGELAFCATLTAVYIWHTWAVASNSGFSLLPRRIGSSSDHYYYSLFSKPLLNLSMSLYIQSGIKYLLTQGDTIVSTTLASLEDQGMYALSANYGGLIARMVFRPIEDSSRNLFAKLCSGSETPIDKPQRSVEQQSARAKTASDSVRRAHSIIWDLLRVYSIVSLIAFTIGPTAAPLLLRLVAGSRWSNSGAGEVLGVYCYCIPLLAINGVSEAFVAATASTAQLHRQSFWMGAFSLGFAGSAYLFLRVLKLGAKGLVLANCVNMASRILFNLNFVRGYFEARGIKFSIAELLPNAYAIGISAVMLSTMSILHRKFATYGLLGELIGVGGVGTVLTLSIAAAQHRYILDLYRKYRS